MSLDLGTLTAYLEIDDKKAEAVVEKFPEKLKGSGAAMGLAAGLVAAGVGAALSSGLEQALDVDDAKHKLTAQLGLTQEESARIGQVAGKLYSQNFGSSVEEVSTAVGNVVTSIDGMRDASADALDKMTAKALNFSSAFEVDTARSTQIVGQLIKTGLVKDANEGFDLLTAAMQRVPAGVREDILDAADEYGPFFQQLGISGSDAMGLLVEGAQKGMYGIDKAGDAVKEFTIRATDMSTTTGAAYNTLGLDQKKMTDLLLAGGDKAADAFGTIVEGLQQIQDPAAQSQAALALFGTPLEDLGTGQIPKFLDSLWKTGDGLKGVEGAADRMGASLNGSASKGWETLSRTWDSIIGQVGQALLPVLTAVIDFLQQNPAVLQIVAAAIGVLALAFIGLTVATWAMNTALLANPITWVILGIVALIAAIVLLIANWDAVVKFLGDTWNGFISWFTGVMDGFFAWWNGMWAGFGGFITDTWNGFVGWIQGIWQGFVDWIMAGLAAYYSWWIGVWSGIVGFLQSAWNGAIAWLRGIPGWIMGVFVGIGSWLLKTGSDLIGGLLNGVKGMWNSFIGWLQGVPGTILGFFAGIGSWLWDAGKNLIQGLLNGIKSLAGTIGSFFLGLLPGWIVGPFKAALGIHSPSTVFAGFGRNIAQGIVVGLDDEQAALDKRVQGLVSVPTSTAASEALVAAAGAMGGQPTPTPGDGGPRAALVVHGNVGWSVDELEEKLNTTATVAEALSGMDEEVPVA